MIEMKVVKFDEKNWRFEIWNNYTIKLVLMISIHLAIPLLFCNFRHLQQKQQLAQTIYTLAWTSEQIKMMNFPMCELSVCVCAISTIWFVFFIQIETIK